jgi:hypothetical protein
MCICGGELGIQGKDRGSVSEAIRWPSNWLCW